MESTVASIQSTIAIYTYIIIAKLTRRLHSMGTTKHAAIGL